MPSDPTPAPTAPGIALPEPLSIDGMILVDRKTMRLLLAVAEDMKDVDNLCDFFKYPIPQDAWIRATCHKARAALAAWEAAK